ncbi:MAG: polynucleotide kinase-phosphatase [Corynebacterium sp.]|uniref:polynucleotide kinase-phosphatase n=1 Tax=Corynebacterium sp. TaxID=1720 RepID=UPI0026DBDC84|nr:polynucleotide kinase-phosphatase [Corynebacterium sp.]MDO5029330.1 polynucleotide kinase-phosphatase [Corynebacterium sp.]
MSVISIPNLSLVMLVGVSGAGKSTFAARHFGPFEVVSSDTCRGIVSNDPNNQAATAPAFELLESIVGKRLDAGLLTVVDATNVKPQDRARLVKLARSHNALSAAIVLNLPLAEVKKRHAERTDRDFGAKVLERQHRDLRRGLKHIKREKIHNVFVLNSAAEINDVTIERTPLKVDRSNLHGPFDIIGDIHGCFDELTKLLGKLGYELSADGKNAHHSDGRTAIFVGDLVDRGPNSPAVLKLVMGMVGAGNALCVPGNHDSKLVRALDGHNVTTKHGLAETLEQLSGETPEFRKQVRDFIDDLPVHFVLDDGSLVVAHAGLPEYFHGRASGKVREFALYGATTGNLDENGLPERLDWAADYRGSARVVYGHMETTRLRWVNNTMCIDTGCVFGGKLSALRYPELDTVQVDAAQTWWEAPVRSTPERPESELRITDVLGIDGIQTSRHGRIRIDDDRATAALETISRFTLAPEKIPYLPPTMSPAPTARRDGFLEHPEEAFRYYTEHTDQVICQEKHMGSRAVLCLVRPGATTRFGDATYAYTRTGRAFFNGDNPALKKMTEAAEHAGLFEQFGDWVLLDGEMLPWNLKAQGLIDDLYAPTAAAGIGAATELTAALHAATARGVDVDGPAPDQTLRELEQFRAAYNRYVDSDKNIQFAPFQVLASEDATWHHQPHSWHLDIADKLVAADSEIFRHTRRYVLNPGDSQETQAAAQWWLQLTESGGEGIVVKPMENAGVSRHAQPGMKVRGRDYLRMIYGHDYLHPQRLERLKQRNLQHKQSSALREYALGIEALERLAAGEPLHRIHVPVFGVLALESEPMNPRL